MTPATDGGRAEDGSIPSSLTSHLPRKSNLNEKVPYRTRIYRIHKKSRLSMENNNYKKS
ncbi:hypothetical protein HanIR_Chr05g0208451 [Helianthus annuus]|nr:hypothetical protein HanIR_Chr05g0208451 [Helianthus annuus]